MTNEENVRLDKDFTYHPPKPDQIPKYEVIRATGRCLAQMVLTHTPKSREQSLSLTAIEEAVMWANAAIARNEGGAK